MSKYPYYKWQAFSYEEFDKYIKNDYKEKDGFLWPEHSYKWYNETKKILNNYCMSEYLNGNDIMNYIIFIFNNYVRHYNSIVYVGICSEGNKKELNDLKERKNINDI